jgi:hypothetical protein
MIALPPNKALNRTLNSLVQILVVPFGINLFGFDGARGAIPNRLTPIRWAVGAGE